LLRPRRPTASGGTIASRAGAGPATIRERRRLAEERIVLQDHLHVRISASLVIGDRDDTEKKGFGGFGRRFCQREKREL
jgi:hypothetical protein